MNDSNSDRTKILKERLAHEVLVCDGAMGTMFDGAGISIDRCRSELSLSRPDLVRAIHRAYISAGVDIVETNTFAANRIALARFGLENQVDRINEASFKLAKEVCLERGSDILVAGSIGPAASPRRARSVSKQEAVDALVEQVVALDRAGVDILLFETFGDFGTLVSIVAEAREVSSLPVIAQVTFLEDGRTIAGDSPDEVADALDALGVVAIGANCTLGPRGMLKAAEKLSSATSRPLSIQPNAGAPTLVHGQFQYQQNEEYFARAARQFVELGASIVGGCCGTTPRHIGAIAQAVRGLHPGAHRPETHQRSLTRQNVLAPVSDNGRFWSKLTNGEFVVGCELQPPKGSDPDVAVESVRRLCGAGVDAIVIAPTASSRLHISPVTVALLLREKLGIDAILTQTTFDKSALALQADLLGAHAFGLQAVICRTGTPSPAGEYPSLSGVFEVTSIDLIGMLHALNEARDRTGAKTRRATSFTIGARVNPSALDFEEELCQTQEKIAAGADFLVTDPVFDLPDLRRFCAALERPFIPLLLGVTALRDYEHAEYLRYEIPGVNVPDAILKRLRRTEGPDEGLQIACEVVWGAAGLIQGFVAMPSDGSATEGLELIDIILGQKNGWSVPTRFNNRDIDQDVGGP